MGRCKYCGKYVGFFSSVHRECVDKHNKGIIELRRLAFSIFNQYGINGESAYKQIIKLENEYLLADDEITDILSDSLYHVDREVKKLKELMDIVNELPTKWIRTNSLETTICKYLSDEISETSYLYFNKEVSLTEIKRRVLPLQEYYNISPALLTEFLQKELDACVKSSSISLIDDIQLYFDYANEFHLAENCIIESILVDFKNNFKQLSLDYFAERIEIDRLISLFDFVNQYHPCTYKEFEDVFFDCINTAAEQYLEDGVISDSERSRYLLYEDTFDLNVGNLPIKWRNSNILKVHQLISLKDIADGKSSHITVNAPIVLSRGEFVAWVFLDSEVYEERTKSEWVGRSSGVSIKLCKGVYYRVGQSKGHKVERSYMTLLGYGALIVTNKNFIFYSSAKSIKVPYKKIIGVVPYSDGIEIQRETNSKRLIFSGFDPWFIMNLFSVIDV